REVARRKPVVVLADPAPSTGVIRVDAVAELFDVGVLLTGQPLPGGHRLGIVADDATLGALAARAAPAAGLTVAAGYPRPAHALRHALDDPGTDLLLLVGTEPPEDRDMPLAVAGDAPGL